MQRMHAQVAPKAIEPQRGRGRSSTGDLEHAVGHLQPGTRGGHLGGHHRDRDLAALRLFVEDRGGYRSTADKLPLITINHGRTDSTDGSVFPYVFPLQRNPYSEVSAIINYIGQKSGGEDKLKGKKIVVLYHGSPYGRETAPVLKTLAKQYGFELTEIEVPHPGNEQGSQWLNIRRIKPDWVILRGWGVMNPVALKSAQKVGFPAERVIGNIWSNSEEDAQPAGDAAKGFLSITTHPSGTDFPVLQAINQYVVKPGKGDLKAGSEHQTAVSFPRRKRVLSGQGPMRDRCGSGAGRRKGARACAFDQRSRKGLNLSARLGCISLRIALLSI